MTGPRVAVIGGGPAGLGAAHRLASRGARVELYERSPEVGGLARSIELWGEKVELGAHLLLLEDRRIEKLWSELIGRSYNEVSRDTRIVSRNRWYKYPYQPLDVARAFGLKLTASCVRGLSNRPPRTDHDLENWIVSRFGRPAFDLLVADYLQKLFGLPASELDAGLASSLLGFRRHPSLPALARAMFSSAPELPIVRPRGGVGQLTESLAADIERLGGSIARNAHISRVCVDHNRVRGLEVDGELREADCVVSTAPLPVLVRLAGGPPDLIEMLKTLRTRSVVVAYLLVSGPAPFPGQWVYIADPGCAVSRVTNFSAWRTSSRVTSVLGFEFWCDPTASLWRADASELVVAAEQALNDIGLASPLTLDSAVHRVPNVFPVISRGYRQIVGAAEDWITDIGGLFTTGRFGSFANSGVHESILMGMDVADGVLSRQTRAPGIQPTFA